MEEKKEDKRVIITKKIIKESLYELLQEKSLEEISITELCIKSQINRGSFYKHYNSIEDAYNENEGHFEERLLEKLDNNEDGLCAGIVKDILNVILENRKLVQNIIKRNNSYDIIKNLVEFLLSKYGNNMSGDELKMLKLKFYYDVGGAFTIIKYWLDNGCVEGIDYLALQIEGITKKQDYITMK